MRELHLFAGAGGGILGGMMLGHEPVCAVEIDKYCRRVLQARQDDGSLPPFPIYEDVRKFDGHAWRGLVDVICGGFPCQPFSCAGKQLGTADPRHLWPEMARIIEEVRPRYVFAENVTLSAFEEPWRDLRRLGYRVPPAICVSASDVGAPHRRKRWWLLAADADSDAVRMQHIPRTGRVAPESCPDGTQEPVADAQSGSAGCYQAQRQRWEMPGRRGEEISDTDQQRAQIPATRQQPSRAAMLERIGSWETEPNVGRVAHGVASKLDRNSRLKAIGNGQVPLTAATAWRLLMEAHA